MIKLCRIEVLRSEPCSVEPACTELVEVAETFS